MTIAEQNHLKGIPELCRVLEVNFRTIALANTRSLARIFILGKEHSQIPSRVYVKNQNRDLRAYGMCKEARICPLCLRERAYVPPLFNSPLALVCPVHRCLLYDECVECGAPITYMRRMRNYCGRCYADFRYFAADPAPDFIDHFFHQFSPPSTEPLIGSHVLEYNTAAFVDIVEGLIARRVVFRYFPRLKRRSLPIMEALLANWPRILFQLADASGYPDWPYLLTQCRRVLAGSPAAQPIAN